MIVRVWVEGAVPMLLHPLLKDGRVIVSLDQFLLELDDQRKEYLEAAVPPVLSFYFS